MPRVSALLHGLDDTGAQVLRLDPDILVMYARAITVAAQPIGLPVLVKRHIRLNALTQPPSP
jgi:hypothetical protein